MLCINSLPSEVAYGYVCVYVPQVLREELSDGLGAWPLHWVEGVLGGTEEELVEEEAMWSVGGASCSPNSISVKQKPTSNKCKSCLRCKSEKVGEKTNMPHKTQLKENLQSLKQKQYVLKAVMYMRMTLKSINWIHSDRCYSPQNIYIDYHFMGGCSMCREFFSFNYIRLEIGFTKN